MLLSSPEFWQRRGIAAWALAPIGRCLAAAGAARRRWTTPWRAPVPVLCVGNIVVGGAGKTPVALGLAQWFSGKGITAHFLTRGYGGLLEGPVRVDPATHDATDVGDEPLLLAAAGPCWVGRDRIAGAQAACAAGAELLIMDDGFQNPTIAKDLALIVVDGGYGIGNGLIMPAGPLRESVAAALARADAVILLGDDAHDMKLRLGERPVLEAMVRPLTPVNLLQGRPTIAFAGIGRPAKFFATVADLGAYPLATRAFPDHHAYRTAELAKLLAEAEAEDALLVTTEKDAVRLPAAWRARVLVVRVEVNWRDEGALDALLTPLLAKIAHAE